jgi:LacI family transcriptional regulator
LSDALNVSVGTVYRALNNKERISQETKQRVLDMAEKMNFKASHAAQSLRRNPIKIGCVLCCPVLQYLEEVKKGVEAAFSELSEFNVLSDVKVLFSPDSSEIIEPVKKELALFLSQKYNGVILFLPNGEPFESIISEIKAAGISIGTVANDNLLNERDISVSADGQCAGRLAAELLHLCCSNNNVAILTGSKLGIHKENINGFLSYAEQHPFKSVEIYEHNDNPAMVMQKIEEMIRGNKKISGLYINSAVSVLACQYIDKLGYASKIKIVTTDLFDETKELLEKGIACATIFQDPYKQGKDIVKHLYQFICDKSGSGKFLLIPQVIFTSNMNMYK